MFGTRKAATVDSVSDHTEAISSHRSLAKLSFALYGSRGYYFRGVDVIGSKPVWSTMQSAVAQGC